MRGLSDIHESDLELQKKVSEQYLELAGANDDLHVVECYSAQKGVLDPYETHKAIVNLIVTKGLL